MLGGDTDESGWNLLGLTPDPSCNCRFQTGTITWYQASEINKKTNPLRNPLVRTSLIADGTSRTMLFGEKYVNGLWTSGGSWGDNAGWYVGRSWDTQRFAVRKPRPDTFLTHLRPDLVKGYRKYDFFGAAHPHGFNCSMADGSVDSVSFDVDMKTLMQICNRQDGIL